MVELDNLAATSPAPRVFPGSSTTTPRCVSGTGSRCARRRACRAGYAHTNYELPLGGDGLWLGGAYSHLDYRLGKSFYSARREHCGAL